MNLQLSSHVFLVWISSQIFSSKGKTDLPGVAVKCTRDQMEILIATSFFPGLDLSSLHLLDSSCRHYSFNATHALLKAPLDRCGTRINTSEDYFEYFNAVMGEAKPSNSSALITRQGRVEIDFQCSFKRIRILSIDSYSARQKKFHTSDEGLGNFTIGMDMYKDPQYDVVVTEYPVHVYPGQPIYFQVNVESRDRSLLIFLDECWVTPTSNPRDKIRATLIKDGCPHEATLKHSYEMSPTQKFTFAAFHFRGVSSRRLFVHCDVLSCARSDSGSVCEKGCSKKRRTRRERLGFVFSKDVSLSLGPVDINKQQHKESTRPMLYITTLAGSLGGLAVCLVAASVLLIVIRRRRHTQT